MMEFDKNKVLTAVTAEQAEVGSLGWFADSLNGLKRTVERDEPSMITHIQDDFLSFRFLKGKAGYMLFYPASYNVLQAKWVEENDIKVGDKVMVCKKWENGPKGSGYENSMLVGEGDVFEITKIESGCLVCSGKAFHCNVDTGWRLPFFAIEKVEEELEPKYRPFASAEEYKPHRGEYIQDRRSRCVYLPTGYNEGEVKMGEEWVGYSYLFDHCVFADTGEPAGVKV